MLYIHDTSIHPHFILYIQFKYQYFPSHSLSTSLPTMHASLSSGQKLFPFPHDQPTIIVRSEEGDQYHKPPDYHSTRTLPPLRRRIQVVDTKAMRRGRRRTMMIICDDVVFSWTPISRFRGMCFGGGVFGLVLGWR